MPTFRREPTPGDALSRYRNALVRDAPPEELARLAAPLDPELVETLHWARETAQRTRQIPDPRFAQQLERDLRQAFPATSANSYTFPFAPGTSLDAPQVTAHIHVPAPAHRAQPVAQPRWTWRQLAVVTGLVVLLAGSLVAPRLIATTRPTTQLGAVGEPTTETFVAATVTGAAATWTPLTVEHWRFQPGEATLTIPPLDGPQWIVADGGGIVATVDGEARALAPGESLVVPAGQSLTLRNPGLGESSAYRGVAAAGFSFEEYDPAVITRETALNVEAHEAIPPGQSRIVFDRLTIPPGTLMTAEAATGQDWFDIVTGNLGLTLIGDSVPQGWESGRERELAADDPVPILVPGTDVTMRNVGDDPLVLLRLRVSSLVDDATAGPSE